MFGKTVPGTRRVDTGKEFELGTETVKVFPFGYREEYTDVLKVVNQDTVQLREKITDHI